MAKGNADRSIPEQPWSIILDMLHAIAVAGTKTSDEDALLEKVTEIVGDLLNPDNFGVMLLDRKENLLILHPSYRRGAHLAHLESVPLGKGITGHVAQSGQPLRVDDVTEDTRYITVNPQVKSELCVPLMINDEVIGVIDAESTEPAGFSPLDEQALVTIAAQVATTLDRLRRTTEAKRQTQRISAIYELGRKITAILQLDELLPVIVSLITETLNVSGVQIALIEDHDLVCRASQNGDGMWGERIALPEKGTLLGNVLQRGESQTIVEPKMMVDPCGVGLKAVDTEVVIPLRLNSAVIGVLVVTIAHHDADAICELALLEFLADQVAVAIQNAQLFAAAQKKTQELTSLYETALVTSSVLETTQLVQRLYEQIDPLLSPEDFYMVLYDPVNEDMDIAFSVSEEERRPKIRRLGCPLEEGGLTGWVMRNRSSLLISDVRSESLPVKPNCRSEMRSWLGIPLIAHQQLIGALSVRSSERDAFDKEHQRFLESMAHQVAITLANARLHHQAVTTAERLAVLHWSRQKLISIHADAEEVYRAIHESVSRLMKSEAFVIALLDRKRQEIYFPYLVDREERRPSQRVPRRQCLSHQVIATGRSLRIPDLKKASEQEDIPQFHFGDPDHIRSLLAAPLKLRGSVFGMISTQSYQTRAYSPEDQRLLEMLASDAAIALENARLFIAERQRHRELEAIRQASLHLTSNLELKPVLQAILKHALELVSADDTHIFLYDQESLHFGAARWADEAQHQPFAQPRDHGITHTVARTGQRLIVEDTSTHPIFADTDWEGAILGLPLIIDQRVIGVMNVAFTQPHRFSEEELRVLSLLADHAAIAVRNARLFTEAQERTSELAEALERLQSLDDMKSQFIQNTSHELRTPVTLIRGHAELLEEGSLGTLLPEQQASITVIARRARMLSKMLEDLNVILKTETQKTQRAPVDIVALVHNLLKEFQIRAREVDLTLEAAITAEEAVILGDEVHLNRVVDNLMDNAMKFTEPGGKISLRLWKEDRLGILEVTDTGIGIPPNECDHIFERFYQVDGSMTRRHGGTGLGLALVKEIVEAHGGEVGIQSTPGEGSTFRVTLPLMTS